MCGFCVCVGGAEDETWTHTPLRALVPEIRLQKPKNSRLCLAYRFYDTLNERDKLSKSIKTHQIF